MNAVNSPTRFTLISIFPGLIDAFTEFGIVRRACEQGHIVVSAIDPRQFADDKHGRVDDKPYGGGPGMVMMVQPLRAAIAHARQLEPKTNPTVAYLSPQGRRLDQALLQQLRAVSHLILVAGRYEGIDERIIEHDIDIELSLGDFVLSGGEIAALAVVDGIVRLLPNVVGNENSVQSDTFSDGLLEYPQFTRPARIDGQAVPEVLLSGDHPRIARWRRKQALGRTWQRRPDLVDEGALSSADQELLAEFQAENAATWGR